MSATLARRLGLAEAAGISIAIICPSVGMAFNVVLCVQAAGAAAPLTFVLGTLMLLVVAASFIAFSRRHPHAGAAYAYIADAFGPWAGVVAGWTMLLAYICFAAGMGPLTADFLIAAFGEAGVHADSFAIPIALICALSAACLAWRDARFASRLMLLMEFVSMAAILILAFSIFIFVQHHHRWTAAPFTLRAAPGGLPALGYGLVFALLSFAGFEGAATLSEETRNPQRNVPLAMIGTVLGAGLFFVVVSYAVVLGYGMDHLADLAGAQAPLDDLARLHLGRGFALLLDVANAISAFSSILGALTGAVRLLFALGRAGLSPKLAMIDHVHRTPSGALWACLAIILLMVVATMPFTKPGDDYGYMSTIAILALIPVYAAVTLAEAFEAAKLRRFLWMLLGLTGTVALGWSFLCSVTPVPPPPANLWPPLVLVWIVVGACLPLLRPRLRR